MSELGSDEDVIADTYTMLMARPTAKHAPTHDSALALRQAPGRQPSKMPQTRVSAPTAQTESGPMNDRGCKMNPNQTATPTTQISPTRANRATLHLRERAPGTTDIACCVIEDM